MVDFPDRESLIIGLKITPTFLLPISLLIQNAEIEMVQLH
jgi:hypothetical protein